MASCPPGVLCISHLSLLLALVVCVGLVFYTVHRPERQSTVVEIVQQQPPPIRQANTLLNPLVPPLRTRPFENQEYQQLGILKGRAEKPIILPLLGRSIHAGRDKWNYFTFKDGSTLIKLPVVSRGKACMNEYGCDSLYNGDTVYVEGYDGIFTVTIYDSATYAYSPRHL